MSEGFKKFTFHLSLDQGSLRCSAYSFSTVPVTLLFSVLCENKCEFQ